MPLDLAHHLGATTRFVRDLERDGRPAKAVVATRVYDTDPADLWDAVTRAERLRRWFAPVTGDLRLGGRFQIEGNASGTVTECEPPRRLAATWEFGGAVSWVTVTLSPEGAGTRLELEHLAHHDPHWERFGPGAVGVGWELGLLGLALHLADPSAPKPPEAEEAWFATDEARGFVRGASDGWGSAAIAGGEDRARALAAAEATRRFYTGEAAPEG